MRFAYWPEVGPWLHSPRSEQTEELEEWESGVLLCSGWIAGFNLKGLLDLFQANWNPVPHAVCACDESAAAGLKPQLVPATTFRIPWEVLWVPPLFAQYSVNFVSSMTSHLFFLSSTVRRLQPSIVLSSVFCCLSVKERRLSPKDTVIGNYCPR